MTPAQLDMAKVKQRITDCIQRTRDGSSAEAIWMLGICHDLIAALELARQDLQEAQELSARAWAVNTDEKFVAWHRDMALRIAEDRDEQKHRARNAEADLTRERTIRQQLREYLRRNSRQGELQDYSFVFATVLYELDRLEAQR